MQRMFKIAHERHGFKEDFGKHDCRTDVEIDTACVHPPHEFSEETEIRVCRLAETCAISARVKVRDVGSD